MRSFARTPSRREINVWPGWVDALSSLIMVIIFVLLVFVIGHFFLAHALTGRDERLERLSQRLADLTELLALERTANTDLRTSMSRLSGELRAAAAARDGLAADLAAVRAERDALSASSRNLTGQTGTLADRLAAAQARIARLEGEVGRLAAENRALDRRLADRRGEAEDLAGQAERLRAQISELDRQLVQALNAQDAATKALAAADDAAATRSRTIRTLEAQLDELQRQLDRLTTALTVSEQSRVAQRAEIEALTTRLNDALVDKVEELSRYRSTFLANLSRILEGRADIRVVGDRFVLQSEVLFESGTADLGVEGRRRLDELARALAEIAAQIPDTVDWILRVDGHTDARPIATPQFPSNWELSTARAISVVKFLAAAGLSERRLAAAGFGAHQPLDDRSSLDAYARNRRIELRLDRR